MKQEGKFGGYWRRILELVSHALHLFRLLYVIFLRVKLKHFVVICLLDVAGRVFGLLAFVTSIQAIYIAFQSAISNGENYVIKPQVAAIGLPDIFLPWLMACVVVIVFAMPALLKRFETRLIAQIIKENHRFAEDKKIPLLLDLFITQRGAQIVALLGKLGSGVLFILIAFIVIAILRFDLFVLVLLFSIVVGVGVVVFGLRNINRVSAQLPLRTAYIADAQHAYDPDRKQKMALLRTIPAPSRERHFQRVIKNWANSSRAGANQAIFSGVAIAAVVLYVFSLDSLEGFQLFLLLYLVISIRFALNTAREVGLSTSKVLDLRMQMAVLTQLYNARLGHDTSGEAGSLVRDDEE